MLEAMTENKDIEDPPKVWEIAPAATCPQPDDQGADAARTPSTSLRTPARLRMGENFLTEKETHRRELPIARPSADG
ncbi:hypothetical protein NicSoilE8_36570 [Arthrobacter sp. NicSoilE8]|nr:hypothetical protein NicSoilE8_36570 [Arthrobacter sp. NicSoilE8]